MKNISLEKRLSMRQRPDETVVMYQEFRELLFLNWKYDPNLIQKTLPPGLFVDTYKGDAYITIVPHKIQNFSVAQLPTIPFFSDFIAVNVRTYVYNNIGEPGIWFYSLDINSIAAAVSANAIFSLPYEYATLKMDKHFEKIDISGKRSGKKRSDMRFTYASEGNLSEADPQSLDFFLVERYVLFTYSGNKLYTQRVHHSPYPISKANEIKYDSHLFELNSLKPPSEGPDLAIYSSGVDVDFFPLKRL